MTVSVVHRDLGLAAQTPRAHARRAPRALRALLIAGCAAAAGAAAHLGHPAAYLQADPGLAQLLRGMALIKASMVAVAVAVLWWRFGRPAAARVAAVYVVGAWMLAGATMTIWQLSHLAAAVVVFHTAELSMLLVAWREHKT